MKQLWSTTISSHHKALVLLLLMSCDLAAGWQLSAAGQGSSVAVDSSTRINEKTHRPVSMAAKSKTKKKKKKKSSSSGGGGGFGLGASKAASESDSSLKASKPPKRSKVRQITLPNLSPEMQAGFNNGVSMLVNTPKADPAIWLAVARILVNERELAEAWRVFRIGAKLFPDNEDLSLFAKGFSGSSADYYHGEPQERPPGGPSASLLTKMDDQLKDEGFDEYIVPPDDVLKYDPHRPTGVDWTRFENDVTTRGAIFKSKAPLLKPSDCKWVIEQVEKQAEESGGWTTARHTGTPTTDIEVSKVPAIREWFDTQLREVLFPMLHARYPKLIASPDEFRVMDAFVVRYDAQAQASLPVHEDQSDFSFTIALNDQTEYEGGGTGFEAAQHIDSSLDCFDHTVLNADAGGVVAFPGKLMHGGNTITKGRRYIIPLFIYADVNFSGRKPGYFLKHLEDMGMRTGLGGDAPAPTEQEPVVNS